jgi:hypothetical protein
VPQQHGQVRLEIGREIEIRLEIGLEIEICLEIGLAICREVGIEAWPPSRLPV